MKSCVAERTGRWSVVLALRSIRFHLHCHQQLTPSARSESWRGWWGDNPVYHVPVFVLTHYARAPLVMEGGTTFYFVTEGIGAPFERAREAAHGKDVRVGGGVNVIQQYLRQRLIDEMHIAIAPVLLGSGERLFEGVEPLEWVRRKQMHCFSGG